MLRRLINNGFGDTFQEPEISTPSKQHSVEFYKEHKQAPTLKPKDPLSEPEPSSAKQQYLNYQKEVQAGRLSQNRHQPQSPGKILKLPLDSE
ncbi:MAG: hypothetical protein HOK67_33735 [Deltaproteobacteria bacterium]|jgi:hypothetical protein|nr:hypothetical protein [Deltaproteobacteria bacterium]MBT4639367.1 hypothetical protein [Deltaproteobacteria bacterium]MBT6504860.1 hypothetical protein [Deltaproteobacteria bacterium]MBT6614483.1 hypothetical protein [Deltaproteobacteria bacterium]MBT7154479.1 hypothetical protein [Deltaproteobacteria bacterium]